MDTRDSDDRGGSRLEGRLRLVAITSGLSLAASVAALAVSVVALRREPAPALASPSRGPERALAAEVVPPRAPSPPRAPAPPPPDEGTPSRTEAPSRGDEAPPHLAARQGPVPPAVAPVAERLHVRGEALAHLVGADGALPADTVARLDRASDAGKALGRRLGLDEPNAQVLANLFVDHAIALIDDPVRTQSITQDTLDGVRAAAGESAVAEAERALAKLR